MRRDQQANTTLPISKCSTALERRGDRALHHDGLIHHGTNSDVRHREDLRRPDIVPAGRRDHGHTIFNISAV